ncbi:hypothetical protein CONPUDRAFT_131613 [Coniophora puteana RWD-64-598 SS2]|uniref:Golgi apparatus membrane protein TVP38 n=1 Tax=Coniophora puteana (strain RWD-64-598) TaxID=741705 RepID=A0A5M3MAE5_CONPW|nr:uncharacterized protein CONPUDRAFT_131613 [Coniophora puteana RWD-64-598 SS2]EIW76077.1 hypothetical protein CONPUDRAFT_131613 [Coniophora puteana RWD-64-598 SS2]
MDEARLEAPQPYHPSSDNAYAPTQFAPMPSYEMVSATGQDTAFIPPRYDAADDATTVTSREITRTPSPTPSEAKAMKSKGFLYDSVMQAVHCKTWRDFIPIVILIFILSLVILMGVFQSQIITVLVGPALWIHALPAGWLIPIAVMIVLSFPPLFGHEFIAMMCGLVWGPWIGFAIVAAGTILGEVILFFVARYGLRKYMDKKTQEIRFQAMGRVVEQEGFKAILAARYSVIPSHFTTLVFAAFRVPFWKVLVSIILSLPTQLANVWIGYDLSDAASGTNGTRLKIITYVVLGVTIAVTMFAMHYLRAKIQKATVEVVHQRRKARQAKLDGFPSAFSSSQLYESPESTECIVPSGQRDASDRV